MQIKKITATLSERLALQLLAEQASRMCATLIVSIFLSCCLLAATSVEFGESLFLINLNCALPMPHNFETSTPLNKTSSKKTMFRAGSNQLFLNHPKLVESISYIKLGNLPTPIQLLKRLSNTLSTTVYLKNDGVTNPNSTLFGGNKVRKLEFLLADALAHGAQSVLTFGAAGSNHVAATACYAQAIGLKCIAMLKKQPNAQVVKRNLLLMQHYNSELHEADNASLPAQQSSYLIPTGGSTPIGILGYVNAAFELKQQIDDGLMPEPDYIYVPAGSFGTTVGLLLGIKATQLKTKLKAVLVEPLDIIATQQEMINLFNATNELLCETDSSFPLFKITTDELNLIANFTGPDYGQFTKEGKNALIMLHELENIKLDGTYTAKAFAALLNDINNGTIDKNSTVLFWHTFCNNDFKEILATQDYKQLPQCFHEYFQQDVQPFDTEQCY